jgi:hypothetical protein
VPPGKDQDLSATTRSASERRKPIIQSSALSRSCAFYIIGGAFDSCSAMAMGKPRKAGTDELPLGLLLSPHCTT